MRFVVHEHWARRHHFDFRLEMDGALRSWAVPKGVPTTPGEKRLAVSVEDHALSYIDFEGRIEEGYGKGDVRIFDRGEYELEERGPRKLVFVLGGSILNGRYVLIHWKENDWLMLKKNEMGTELI